MANKDKVIKMHRFPSLNVGIVVFLIIIIYMAFNLISYLTSSPVAEYEVGQGTIATNHVYFNSFGTNYVKNIKNGGKKNNEMVR